MNVLVFSVFHVWLDALVTKQAHRKGREWPDMDKKGLIMGKATILAQSSAKKIKVG